MAVFTQKMRDRYNAATHREFIMDGDDESKDLAELPGLELCARGSLAQHIKTGNWFILDSNGNWVSYPNASSGSGGSAGGGSVEVNDELIASDGEVDEMLNEIFG